MQLRKYRWSKDYESAEEELVELLALKHITAERHDLEEEGSAVQHTTAADTQLWCAEGMMRMVIGTTTYSLQPGDVVDLPAGTTYELLPRFGGGAYYLS
jgi:mannose-6-phosphate isomerase-like protein (cupin superfamily)